MNASNLGKGQLEDSIKEILAPILREDGFKGSGRVYRRVVGELINIVSVYSSRHGGQFAIHMGIHPLAVPDVLGNAANPAKMTESLCEFGRRLSEGTADQWWQHDTTRASMDRAVRQAASLYMNVGRPMFAALNSPTSPILNLSPNEFGSRQADFHGFGTTKFRKAVVLARLRHTQDRPAECRGFAEIALEAHPGMSAQLREELYDLVRLGSCGEL